MRGVGGTVGASEEFERALEGLTLATDPEGIGIDGEVLKAKRLQNENARQENAKTTEKFTGNTEKEHENIEGVIKREASDKEEWGANDPWPESMEESLIHEML